MRNISARHCQSLRPRTPSVPHSICCAVSSKRARSCVRVCRPLTTTAVRARQCRTLTNQLHAVTAADVYYNIGMRSEKKKKKRDFIGKFDDVEHVISLVIFHSKNVYIITYIHTHDDIIIL